MLYVILGKSNAGKTTFAEYLSKKMKLEKVITCTTRPIRPYEFDGIDYNFLSEEEANNIIKNKDYVEYVVFNGWTYCTRIKDIDINKNQVIVMNPEGYKTLKLIFGEEMVLGVYLKPNFFVRLIRILKRDRGNYKEAFRRFIADSKDFRGLKADIIIGDILF